MPAEALERLASLDALLHTLSNSDKKIAFLVGSPLSMPDTPGAPGIPGTAGMLELVRASLSPGLEARFDSTVAGASSAQQYQLSMNFLRSYQGQDAVNAVIQKAVLHSRLTASETDAAKLHLLDDDVHGWYLPAGTRDLGKLVVAFPERFGPILTTNFDPLISVAIRKAGGRVSQIILPADGRLDAVRHERDVHSVVHLHGHWAHSDTLHTPSQLTQERPNLDASLQTLLRQYTLVVIGYSGWDDVITQALARCGNDFHANVDIVWAFFESNGALIHLRYKSLFSSIRSIHGRGRFREYGDINCHTLFKDLHSTIERGATPTTIAPPPSVPEEAPALVAAKPRLDSSDVDKNSPLAINSTLPGVPTVSSRRSLPEESQAMTSAAFEIKPYASFEQFIKAVRTWAHGPGARSAQLCGCTTTHTYGTPWTSFKLQHFNDNSNQKPWNGTYVVNADTKRTALLKIIELMDAGKSPKDILVPGKTTKGTLTVLIFGRSKAAGFYNYQRRTGVPLDAVTPECVGRTTNQR